MARLSFDYAQLLAHPRFKAYVRRLGGDQGRALDGVLRFWNAALHLWGEGRQLVPLEDFELDDDFRPLVDCRFAEVRENGVYAKGAQDNFDWLTGLRSTQSRAGQASAEARKVKFGSSQPHRSEETSNGSPNETSNGPNAFEPVHEHVRRTSNASISTSISTSTSASSEHCEGVCAADAPSPPEEALAMKPRRPRPKQPAPSSAVWDAYHSSYVARYGSEPIRNARTNGQCSQLVSRLGLERAVAVAGWYVGHSDFFYVKNLHPLGLALKDAEALWTQYETGRKVTTRDARSAEIDDVNRGVFERLAAKMQAEEAQREAIG